ncbi:MAG: hypothetical protein SOH93_07610 [Oscillospiraceae bacterium]|jgi:niacin transporter
MNKSRPNSLLYLVFSGLLCGISIMIPMVFPKIVIEPMSFTLASHVPTFLAIFISPAVAVATCIASAIGFFITTSPVIAMRALSHIGFVLVGCLILKKKSDILQKPSSAMGFGFVLSLVHALCETLVVTAFYFGGAMTGKWYANGFLFSVILLVGGGTILHSIVDFTIAVAVWKPVQNFISIPVAASMKKKVA